jgi:hypothetical protein
VYAKHQPLESDRGGYVPGVIEAWGRIEVGGVGFRAEHARIVALAMPACIIPDEFAEFMYMLRGYKGVTFYPTKPAMFEAFPPIDVSALLPPQSEPRVDFSRGGFIHSWKGFGSSP